MELTDLTQKSAGKTIIDHPAHNHWPTTDGQA